MRDVSGLPDPTTDNAHDQRSRPASMKIIWKTPMPLDLEWTPLLRKIFFLADLTDEERTFFHPLFRQIPLATGECLFRQGDGGNALHLLISGELEVIQEQAGKTHRVATLSRRGDLLGEMALWGGDPCPGTATALQPTVLMELTQTKFQSALRQRPSLSMAISRALARRLMHTLHTPAQTRTAGKVFVLMGALAARERLGFTLNLALSTLEQTRRRVLLVDVSDDTVESAISHLSRNSRGVPTSMDPNDFQSVDRLRTQVLGHASGLDLLFISDPLLQGRLGGELTPLATTARQEWDYVFISLPGRSSHTAKTLWEEADRTLYIREESSEKGGPLWREMETQVPSPRLDLVELQRNSSPRRNRPGRFYVPWRDGIGRNADLFLTAHDGFVQKGLNRMARHLGGCRIGIAMGSGAAMGYSVIGILRALERNGIFPDLIAGTSMGALVGSFYASGRPVEELVSIALRITKKRLWSMVDFDFPWKGLVVGNGVLRFLKSVIGHVTFDQLQLPFACVATDIHTGREQVLRHGAVAEAVRGSLSLPFFFEPFFWQGRYLVDGGLVNPVPTSIAQAMGANITLSVNNTLAPALKSLPRSRRPSAFNPIHGPHIFKVMAKTLYTMQYGIAKAGASEADVVIAPNMSGFGSLEFHRAAEIIAIGEEEAEKIMPKIKAKLPFFTAPGSRSLHGTFNPPTIPT